jgi:negative regulator of replication initiation
MKNIEVSDEVYAALQRLATDSQRTPDEVLASLLQVPAAAVESVEPLAAFVMSSEFPANSTDGEKYLALLSWIAARHAAEFGEFIRSQAGGRHYLTMSRDEIVEACRHNQARQIDGTQYWAIMNIEPAMKRRFLARMLEFIGYRDDVIHFACNVLGGRGTPSQRLSAMLVA